MNVPDVARALEGRDCGERCPCHRTAQRGAGKTHCPAHQDEHPSLSIREVESKFLVHCHAGCRQEEVLAALRAGTSTGTSARNGHQPARRISSVYDYTDEDGRLLFQVVRFAPKGFAQRLPGANQLGLNGTKPVLYRLPELLATQPGDVIFIVEGEKDAERLHSLGVVATTSRGGAGKWRREYASYFAGRHAVILPDNDEAGQNHAEQVAASLYGIVSSVKVVELPDLPEKGDASDWLDQRGTLEQLRDIIKKSPSWEPVSSSEGLDAHVSSSRTDEHLNPDEHRNPDGHRNRVRLVPLASVAPESVAWLWEPYIARGKVTALEGDPGVGKSWATLALATAVSLGHGLPGVPATDPVNVLLCSAEDGLGDSIRPRLDTLGADVSRIFAIEGPLTFDEEGFATLERYLAEVRPALVTIDPIVAYIGAGVDIHRANEVRAVMARLADLAQHYCCAVLVVRHLTKNAASKAIYRGQGSIDFTAACRSVLLAGCDPDDNRIRALVQTKNNLRSFGPAVGYTVEAGRFLWTGRSDLTAARILASEGSDTDARELERVKEYLCDVLADGPLPQREVEAGARTHDIAGITLRRAREALGIRTIAVRESGKRGVQRWDWVLPADA